MVCRKTVAGPRDSSSLKSQTNIYGANDLKSIIPKQSQGGTSSYSYSLRVWLAADLSSKKPQVRQRTIGIDTDAPSPVMTRVMRSWFAIRVLQPEAKEDGQSELWWVPDENLPPARGNAMIWNGLEQNPMRGRTSDEVQRTAPPSKGKRPRNTVALEPRYTSRFSRIPPY